MKRINLSRSKRKHLKISHSVYLRSCHQWIISLAIAVICSFLPSLRWIGPLGLTASASAIETYTTDSDFDKGVLLSVNHNFPNNNQLQLDNPARPFPFVNIAASARGTVIRIDVNTGQILGEYLTAPDGMGRDPSRTTVDKFGSVWVANRAEFGFSDGEFKGSVSRIGLIIGGTRSEADGTLNPLGQYVQPPFQYNTCVDRDGDGRIRTSIGLGDILPWSNSGGVDSHGGANHRCGRVLD